MWVAPLFACGVICLLWIFTTPVIEVVSPSYSDGRVTAMRFKETFGVTVLRVSGVWQEVRSPSADLVASADRVYRGGYQIVVDDDRKAELVSAGYGDQITRLPDQVVDPVEDVLL